LAVQTSLPVLPQVQSAPVFRYFKFSNDYSRPCTHRYGQQLHYWCAPTGTARRGFWSRKR